jgi:hypothetical protein
MSDAPKAAQGRHEPRDKPWAGVIVAIVLILLLLASCLGITSLYWFVGA